MCEFTLYNSMRYMDALTRCQSPLQRNVSIAADYLPFGFRLAFGLVLSAFSAAKGWSLGSGGVIS